ncbi:major allergen Can f 1-like [Dromiciops gliroides]|uniref:major allergen Can f 1-like n=1 Tax=Dromiciops gliroides TaxID=33562 RepID=UPI001CC7F955|nr:major allergen Can f 1-like [Dromiciops gliroides]
MKVLFLIFLISVIHAWEYFTFDKNISKVYGMWFINAWMGNMEIPDDKKNQKIPPFTFRSLPNGKMEAKLNLKKNGRCEEIKLTLEKTKEPGKMTTWGKQTIGLIDIFIKDHMIAYIESRMNGKDVIMMQLMGRSTTINPEALKLFREFVQSKGLDKTKITMVEPQEKSSRGVFDMWVRCGDLLAEHKRDELLNHWYLKENECHYLWKELLFFWVTMPSKPCQLDYLGFEESGSWWGG